MLPSNREIETIPLMNMLSVLALRHWWLSVEAWEPVPSTFEVSIASKVWSATSENGMRLHDSSYSYTPAAVEGPVIDWNRILELSSLRAKTVKGRHLSEICPPRNIK